MSLDEIKEVSANAGMIVGGYAFTRMDGANIHVLQLHAPYHALVLSGDDEVLETSMDDVELDIVLGYWQKNRKYMEEQYA